MAEYHKIFISHSHRDRHFATELQTILKAQGAGTYLDQDKIQAGDSLPDRIRKGISWCDTFLLIWSLNAAASVWVGKEWNVAYDLRKKIIPYCLDSAPLPNVLQNLVRVEADDRKRADANLLMAVFGDGIIIDPRTLFPGKWHASVEAFGFGQASYDLELRPNGQLEGTGSINNSGLVGQMAGEMGMGDFLNMRYQVHGSWSYDRGSKTLIIEALIGFAFGPQQNETIRILATGYEKGTITGQDLAGRAWSFRRVEVKTRSIVEDGKRMVRSFIQKALEKEMLSPAVVSLIAMYGRYLQEEKYKCDLGFPVTEANKFMNELDDASQVAYKEFVQALKRGGWID